MKKLEFILKILGLAWIGQLVSVFYFGIIEIIRPERYNYGDTLTLLLGTLIVTYFIGVAVYESSKNIKK